MQSPGGLSAQTCAKIPQSAARGRAIQRTDHCLPNGRRSAGRGAFEPDRRLVGAGRLQQNRGPVELSAEVAALGGTPIPVGGGGGIARRSPPFFTTSTHQVHGALMLLIGRAAIVGKRQAKI